MKLFFSPSKGMNYKNCKYNIENLELDQNFKDKADYLVSVLKSFSKEETGKKLKIKDKILDDVYDLYQNFYEKKEREAICLYDGVSYKQIHVENFSEKKFEYMKENVFIFSALYGVMNATTLIRPYRLDMTNKILPISPYEFWKNEVENYLSKFKDDIFINLASNEFSKILNKKLFNIIDIEFRQLDRDKVKNISTEAKKARGSLLNYIIVNEIHNLEDIKKFDLLDYSFSQEFSSEKSMFFIKKIG
ncbi:YaaA family protein [Cetobacterium somerae]|uniref:YaaA family protein n=1 Tax=Cetobacterium sp. NK01 TaxID=2993530 RepID=UPI0021170387|nr:YaaA family protein [Cetobacterium sp. NK01]MCQ8211095.1 YaaA family protein [Cetobacterium sp. NK01]